MNQKNFKQGFNRNKEERARNAHAGLEFGCPSTPAPTPPGSLNESRKSGVGAGLLDSLQKLNAGELTINKESKSWKTPQTCPSGDRFLSAGFSTLSPSVGPAFGRALNIF